MYESVFDLRSAIEQAGYECSDWEVRADVMFMVEGADCTSDVTLSIHTDATQVQQSIELRAELMRASGLEADTYLTGPNWAIDCYENDACEDLQEPLGGELQIDP